MKCCGCGNEINGEVDIAATEGDRVYCWSCFADSEYEECMYYERARKVDDDD